MKLESEDIIKFITFGANKAQALTDEFMPEGKFTDEDRTRFMGMCIDMITKVANSNNVLETLKSYEEGEEDDSDR